ADGLSQPPGVRGERGLLRNDPEKRGSDGRRARLPQPGSSRRRGAFDVRGNRAGKPRRPGRRDRPLRRRPAPLSPANRRRRSGAGTVRRRSEEHTSELQSRENLVCRLLLEKKKTEKTETS